MLIGEEVAVTQITGMSIRVRQSAGTERLRQAMHKNILVGVYATRYNTPILWKPVFLTQME
jgi:hypothetical protein